jgi:hypothetical protein
MVDPEKLVAVTATRIVEATSLCASVYVPAVALEMFEQLAPDELQSSH